MTAVNRNRLPGSADWSSTSYWSATKGGASGSSMPGTSGDSFSLYVGAGTASITANLDQSAASDIVTLLMIEEGFGEGVSGINIGTVGAPLKYTHASQLIGTLRIQNRRFGFFNLSATGITLIDCQEMGGTLNLSASEVTTGRFGRTGTCNVGENVGITTLHTAGCTINLAADASPPNLVAYIGPGASVNSSRLVLTATVDGVLKMENAASGTGVITVSKGGVLDLRQSGNIAGIVAMPGSTVTGEYTPGWGSTIPTVAVTRYPGANINLPADLFTVTYTDVGNP